ncbi:hypothetical protein BKA62DRAFT_676521 [Auriculariales sp. MPI-PUGE-AT-0066]|nr:hypothetical protein BKA62DRAFT_676521 [Auriculariales sp. MPI-PUGE-AT-0066]
MARVFLWVFPWGIARREAKSVRRSEDVPLYSAAAGPQFLDRPFVENRLITKLNHLLIQPAVGNGQGDMQSVTHKAIRAGIDFTRRLHVHPERESGFMMTVPRAERFRIRAAFSDHPNWAEIDLSTAQILQMEAENSSRRRLRNMAERTSMSYDFTLNKGRTSGFLSTDTVQQMKSSVRMVEACRLWRARDRSLSSAARPTAALRRGFPARQCNSSIGVSEQIFDHPCENFGVAKGARPWSATMRSIVIAVAAVLAVTVHGVGRKDGCAEKSRAAVSDKPVSPTATGRTCLGN